MNETDAYRVLQDTSGIKKGDVVKVTRGAKSYEMGWPLMWMGSVMAANIGKTGRVHFVDYRGVKVGFADDTAAESFYYPFFVLEVLPKPINIPEGYELTGEYRVASGSDYYWSSLLGRVLQCGKPSQSPSMSIDGGVRWILKKVHFGPLDVDPQAGFKWTGEVRPWKKGEFIDNRSIHAVRAGSAVHVWLADCDQSSRSRSDVAILAPTLPKPAKAPSGYELTGEYRVPNKGDRIVNSLDSRISLTVLSSEEFDTPRWILRKADTKPTLPAGFEYTGEHQAPKQGEWYYSPLRGHPWRAGFDFLDAYNIVRKVSPTVEDRLTRLEKHVGIAQDI